VQFQILSHAGLRVKSSNIELLCDPWLIGSCYWRSWWNYPPVDPKLIDSLKPDAIYLTHIHWDHFQGPSLRLFPKEIKIIVPKGNYDRIKRDLHNMGYTNVVELAHGQSIELASDFKLTSYQFGPFLDSAVIIEADGKVLFNANDAKLMGMPLKQVKQRHPIIDFVLRSHSSANSRLCYEYIDGMQAPVDNIEQYIQNFADFCIATGAEYAIPFASNHCFLHKEVFDLNHTVQTPDMVLQHWQQNAIATPKLKIMVSGDSWSTNEGFKTDAKDYFQNRTQHLLNYREKMLPKLEKTYEREANAKIRMAQVEKYFDKLWSNSPWFMRKILVGNTDFLFVLLAGDNTYRFTVNLLKKAIREVGPEQEQEFDAQIHTNVLMFNQCMALDLFSHLSISKRVNYKVTKRSRKYVNGLNLLFNCYEYEIVPLRKLFSGRSCENWLRRWREILLYMMWTKDLLLRKKIDQKKYIQAAS
jgi:UDP-MurNAc hydroxylase